jgi:hypothetical protein
LVGGVVEARLTACQHRGEDGELIETAGDADLLVPEEDR